MDQRIVDIVNRGVDDLTDSISALNRVYRFDVSSSGPNQYGSLTGIKRNAKPFIVGIVPPDNPLNFVPFETSVTPLFSSGLSPSEQPQKFSSASKSSEYPNVRDKRITPVKEIDIAVAIYDNLLKIGYTRAQAERVAPFIAGQTCAEHGKFKNGDTYNLTNYNLANVYSFGAQGEFKNPAGPNTPDNWKKAPRPGKEVCYLTRADFGGTNKPIYAVCGDDLSYSAGKLVETIDRYKNGPKNATTPLEYANALYPNRSGSSTGNFYEGDPTTYARGIDSGAKRIKAVLQSSGKTLGDLSAENRSGANNPITNPTGKGLTLQANGNITDPEDPLGFTGRGIRPVMDNERTLKFTEYLNRLRAQYQAVANLPPLSLLINPQSFKRNYENSSDVVRTRRGFSVHTLFENPCTISSNGVSAAQYIIDASGNGGITHLNRIQSLSYRNLFSLVQIYKNNGNIYSGPEDGSNGGLLQTALSIFIYYDGTVYIGSFNDFSINDTAGKPYNMPYDFKFTVRYEVRL